MNLGTLRGKSRGADDSWSLFEELFCFPCESFLSISIKSNLWLLKIIGLNDLGKMMRGEGKDKAMIMTTTMMVMMMMIV